MAQHGAAQRDRDCCCCYSPTSQQPTSPDAPVAHPPRCPHEPCRSSWPRLCALQRFYGGISNGTCYDSQPLSPPFVAPNRKLSLWDVMAGLRHHNQGTKFDP